MSMISINPDKESFEELLTTLQGAIQKDQKKALEELSRKVVLEGDAIPWATAFRQTWTNADNAPEIINTLLCLSNYDDNTSAYGAIHLLAEINKLQEHEKLIEKLLEKRSGKSFSDMRRTIYLNLIHHYLSEDAHDKAKAFIGKMAKDNDLASTASDLKKFIDIPYTILVKELASGINQAYEQFKHFIETSDSRISRISNSYYKIYKNGDDEQKQTLLTFLDEMISAKNKTPRVNDFISQILGHGSLYHGYVNQIKSGYVSEKLRNSLYRDSDKHVQRSLNNIILKNHEDEDVAYSIAARGAFTKISKSTIEEIRNIIKDYRNMIPPEPALLPEDVSDYDGEEKAHFVLSLTEQLNTLPVQIEDLVQRFNLPIIKLYSDDLFDGCLIRAEGLIFPIILVNTEQWPARKRFTIAHELSHYLLPNHKEYAGFCISEWQQEDVKLEREADSFSAKLLMPKREVVKDINNGVAPWSKVNSLQKKYEVSKFAFLIRALELLEEPPTVLFRFNDGVCDYRKFSKNFPYELEFANILDRLDKCPNGTGADKINSGEEILVEEETDINVWLTAPLESIKGKYKVMEYSSKYGENGILTLLEACSKEDGYLDDDSEAEEHLDYYDSQKRFGYGAFKKSSERR